MMNKKQRVSYIQESLEKLYPNPSFPLNYHNKFTLLIAVLLSAQSTDKKVNEITKEFFKIADSPQKMKRLSLEEIKNHVKNIGLFNTKAKNIYLITRKLLEVHNGMVPNTFEALKSFPGIGHKTASVVMYEAFGVPTFPVDTHVHRLMTLWKLSPGKSVEQTEKEAKKIFSIKNWNTLHLQMIYYGKEYSPARRWRLETDFITRNIFHK